MLNLNSKGKIGVFAFFIPLSVLFNSVGIFHSALKTPTTIYMAIVFFLLLVFSWILNRTPAFSVSVSSISGTPKPILRLLLVVYCFSMMVYFYSTADILWRGLPSPNKVYETRLEAIAIDKYWMLVAITNIGLSLSVVYLLCGERLKWILVTALYVLFFATSMQKSPIANILIIQGFFYVSIYGVSKKFIVGAMSLIFGFGYYLTAVTLGDSDFSRVSLLLSALFERVIVAGYLVADIYEIFGSDVGFFGGATLPKLFGILDLNLTSNNIRLPAFMMELKGEVGGANTSFFTEGFANFGYGGDLAFVLFLYLYTACIIVAVRLLAPTLRPLFILITSVVMIELVHSDIWGFFSSQILITIIFALISLIAKVGGTALGSRTVT